ncbi:uncharacterized protein N7496_004670 [Penicillium cataractarum]|uniref:Zn(2)-C6 fungal-type domain-containing protein n=1 Tax=Penicillium cataractarum TaxID=2100454 RepID=A0A9W9VFA2_9EURO|nr:uncharacterized protein N7496_004670 [Penicillium cataractarum]KAJ5377261.1 hypothetical protein N7496_004670 [Penicillium cataractarum]
MPPSHACDACRRRKVKCDGVEPCANCGISGLRCVFRGSPRRQRLAVRGIVAAATPENVQDLALHAADSTTAPRLEPGSALILDPGSRGGASSVSSFHHDPGHIHAHLVAEVDAILAPESIADLVNKCIDYFFQYLFPNTPIAHEPTLHDAATLLAHEGHSTLAKLASSTYDTQHQVECLRRFTLITAFCAFVTAVMSESRLAQMIQLSRLFLLASRATLQLYEEYDLEHPNSTSLAIRMWYSAAMHNRTGRVGTSHHYHAEAAYLAQRLRLYNENAVQRDLKLESNLLRAMFWLLFLADKTAIVLETRPPILNEMFFSCEFSLLENSDDEGPMLDQSKDTNNQRTLERRIFIGFHLKRRIWSAAADLIAEIRALSLRIKQGLVSPAEEGLALAHLTEAYLLFTGLAGRLPDWLRQPGHVEGVTDDKVAAFHSTCFWTQRSNIMTAFHCMKLVILQTCIDHQCTVIMGLDNSSLAWAIRKTEISQDFLHEMQIVPFICFKVQGETAVERIRRVGSTLLELVHNANNETVQKMARFQFDQLLDFLTRLDSKASNELATGPM